VNEFSHLVNLVTDFRSKSSELLLEFLEVGFDESRFHDVVVGRRLRVSRSGVVVEHEDIGGSSSDVLSKERHVSQ
jgi:hypothetical protein